MKNPFDLSQWRLAPAAASPGAPEVRRRQDEAGSWLLSADDPNRTVRAGRRRRTDQDPSQRDRADAPRRRDDDAQAPSSGSTRPTGSSGGLGLPTGGAPRPPSSGGGFSFPGGTRGAAGGGISMLVLCGIIALVAFLVLGRCGGDPVTAPQPEPTAAQSLPGLQQLPLATPLPLPTATPRPTLAPVATAAPLATAAPVGAAPSTTKPGQTWTIMLYQDADDKILEQDIYIDLNEAERIGSSDRVNMVAQIDRYRGGFNADGNWTGTRRYVVRPDQDLTRVKSELVAEGELNMAAGETLADFIIWSAKNYPADKYVLVMSDHGMGWPGGWSDPDAGQQGTSIDRNVPIQAALGDHLFLDELDSALATARQQAGIDKFELIGMDACLMGHIEVMSALAEHGHYAVFSQETEPALGWAYTAFLGALTQNPDMDGAQLGQQIVQSYIDQDERILDNQARTEWVGRGSSTLGAASAAQLRQQLGRGITLSAIRLDQTPNLVGSLNDLAYAMQGIDQNAVAKARRYTQSFTSIFGQQVPPSYIDLGHFLILLNQTSKDAGLQQALVGVAQSIKDTVIAEKSGQDKPGATGISIYFPTGQVYQAPAAGPQSYTRTAARFAQDSLWDDFLAFHYGGRSFKADTRSNTVPLDVGVTRAPGAGRITLSPVQKDRDQVAIRETVLLSTNVSGNNIGYIYFFTGYLDRASGSIAVIDRDYLEAPQTAEADGVYYPEWGEGDFKLEFEWEPLAFSITDGRTRAMAALMPQTYGASWEETIYTVDGIYRYQDGEQRYARAYFRDGLLRQVFAFTQEEGTPGAPREVTTEAGDQFTVIETWLESDGQGGLKTVTQQGGTLTFQADNPFRWEELDAAAGEYVVGFIAADLEGNTTEAYTTVTVLP